MLFFANRANLDRRQVLTRLHVLLGTQVTAGSGPVEQVWYHTSAGNKVGVRATIDTASFLDVSYPVEEGELQVTFDFPPEREYDHYRIQWVERERELMVGWHQGDAHEALGPCHFQVDYRNETVQRVEALVQFGAVEQPGDAVTDVDEDAELGEAVDSSAVVPTRRQLIRVVAGELEEDVLLVALTDCAVGRSPTDDTRTHLIRGKNSPGLKRLSKRNGSGPPTSLVGGVLERLDARQFRDAVVSADVLGVDDRTLEVLDAPVLPDRQDVTLVGGEHDFVGPVGVAVVVGRPVVVDLVGCHPVDGQRRVP